MGEEKEYGLLIAAIVSIVAIVGLVILFSRGAPVGKLVAVEGSPWTAHYTGAGQTYYQNRGLADYRDCVSDSSVGLQCETGRACWQPSRSSPTGGTAGYVCEPTDYADSPQGAIDAASGRGFWS